MRKHWTERSIEDFIFRIAADFIAQLEEKMESSGITQDELAKSLGVTKGRVSQIFNNPGNLTLKNVAKYARNLGMKASIVAYDDGDPGNEKGPINSEIFKICWDKAGKPHDFWTVQEVSTGKTATNVGRDIVRVRFEQGVTCTTLATPVPGEFKTIYGQQISDN
jgi:transcriptional regulator with XRE-family HTH domain